MRSAAPCLAVCCVAVVVIGFAPPVQAGYTTTLTFDTTARSTNDPTNSAIVRDQIRVDVTDVDSGHVAFKFYFRDTSKTQPTITDIYFADGNLLNAPPTITTTGYVRGFTNSATPQSFVGPSTFKPSQFFTAGADNPQPSKGINPGDTLTFTFTYKAGVNYDGILAALRAAPPDNYTPDTLGIGLKIQNFANGGSEWAVNNAPANPLPAPAGVVLVLSCVPFALVGRLVRRKLTAGA